MVTKNQLKKLKNKINPDGIMIKERIAFIKDPRTKRVKCKRKNLSFTEKEFEEYAAKPQNEPVVLVRGDY